MGACSLLLLIQRAPFAYHAYLGLAVFFWTEIFANTTLLQNLVSVIQSTQGSWQPQVIITALTSFLVLELLVRSQLFVQKCMVGHQSFWISMSGIFVHKQVLLFLQVASFFRRAVYTVIFLIAGVVGAVVVSCNMRNVSMVPAFVWISCWFLSVFTLMPTQISDNTALV